MFHQLRRKFDCGLVREPGKHDLRELSGLFADRRDDIGVVMPVRHAPPA